MKDEGSLATTKRKLAFWFYAILLIMGVLIYITWSVHFGTWNLFEAQNIGLYSVVIILVGFGIVGMLLYYKD